MNGLVGWAASVTASAMAGGGFVAMVQAVAGRRRVRADATKVVTDSALELLSAARGDANEAYREAAEARREAASARREVASLTSEIDALATKVHRIVAWIHDPQMSMESLRMLVPLPPAGPNGVTPPR